MITVEPVGYDLAVDAWQDSADDLLPQQLPNYSLIDRERIDIEGREFIRRLGHYHGDGTGSVTMEQWATICQDRGYTITGSVATLFYDSLANTFAEMALRFRPEASGGPEVLT